MRVPVVGFCIALVLSNVPFGEVGAASSSAAAFDQSWMRPGKFFEFEALNGVERATVRVVIDAVTATHVTTSWIVGDLVQQVVYDRETRRDVANPYHAAFLWVNPEDVGDGGAYIESRWAVLKVSTLVHHRFVSGPREYHYDALTGVLLQSENLATETRILRTREGDATPPPPDNDPKQTVRTLVNESSIVLPTEEPYPEVPEQAIVLECRALIDDLQGGSKTCGAQFWSYGKFEILNVTFDWPRLTSGFTKMTFTDQDGSAYRVWTCNSMGPMYVGYDNATELDCPDPERKRAGGGLHTWTVEGNFDYCLNPLAVFACEFNGTAILKGRVAPG